MGFVNDLDVLAWSGTFAAIVVCGSVTCLNLRDRSNGWTIEVGAKEQLSMILAIMFLVGAFESYSPNANAPRKTVEGILHLVAKVQGRHSFTEYICATSCQLTGGYALALDEHAARVVSIGSNYRFTYLEHPTGGVLSGVSLRVISVFEADSGRVLYAQDLTNHPYRIVAYLLDFGLMAFAVFLTAWLMHDSRRGSAGDDSDEAEPKNAGSISLGLDSTDSN